MNTRGYLEYALKGLTARAGRLLIIAGILAVSTILVMTLNVGVRVFQQIELQSLNTPRVFTSVEINTENLTSQSGSQQIAPRHFTDADFQAVFTDPRVKLINAHIYTLANKLSLSGKEILDQGIIKDVPKEFKDNVTLAAGRNIAGAKEAIVGEDFLNFSNIHLSTDQVLGKEITWQVPNLIDTTKSTSYTFTIVGVESKNDIDADTIRVSEADARIMYNTSKNLDPTKEVSRLSAANMIVQLRSSQDVAQFSKDWKAKGYYITNSQDTIDLIQQSYQRYQEYIYAFSGIVLVIIGLIVFLVMNLTVRERYKEIGVMKAIGARNRSIGLFYVIQGTLLSLLGTLLGTLVFVGVVVAIRQGLFHGIPNELQTASISWATVLLFNGIFLIFAIIGSAVPARKAAQLDPIEAISAL